MPFPHDKKSVHITFHCGQSEMKFGFGMVAVKRLIKVNKPERGNRDRHVEGNNAGTCLRSFTSNQHIN